MLNPRRGVKVFGTSHALARSRLNRSNELLLAEILLTNVIPKKVIPTAANSRRLAVSVAT